MSSLRPCMVATVVLANLGLAASAAEVSGELQSTAETPELEIVLVTGTRQTGLTAADSPAPVQILSPEILQRAGQPDLAQSIAQSVPSFTAQAVGAEAAKLTKMVKLRGLSPNHALVLVNGKRRHTTSNLAVRAGPYQGGAGADLNYIPVAAIERIEVLTDGAAAQYGSDAIAGVINIILRDADSGGEVGLSGGEYIDGGGDTFNATGNVGFDLGASGSYLNLSGEARTHARSDRSGVDPRVVDPSMVARYPNLVGLRDYPYLNQLNGDAQYQLYLASFNAGLDLGDSMQLYSFGTYGRKEAKTRQMLRTPDRIPTIYPDGFVPKMALDESDVGLTTGLKGTLLDAWRWDVATMYGRNHGELGILDSANISLFNDTGSTPTAFSVGGFIATQWTTNLDLNRDFDIGLAGPLNVALGVEYRRERYEIEHGDPASRYKEGSQAFPGFALTDAGSHERHNKAVYVDFAVSPIEKLLIDIAGRYEDFSDFGNTTIGKLTSRYDFTESFALRGTFSTGFRAPTLAEEYYSATNVSPVSAIVQLPPNAPAARLLGIDALKPERSTNYSFGVVLHPAARLSATLDVFQISVEDRIAGSGTLYGVLNGAVVSPAVTAAIEANGNVLEPNVRQTGINIFTNGLDTRTRGADLLVSHRSEHGFGRLDLSIAASYIETEVTKIAPTPAQLAPQALFDLTAISTLESTAPKHRTILSALWTFDQWSINLRETIYGKASQFESVDGRVYYETEIGVTPVTDLELTYQFDAVKITVGGNNIFNRYPGSRNAELLAAYQAQNNPNALFVSPGFSPFGINGGYYFAEAMLEF